MTPRPRIFGSSPHSWWSQFKYGHCINRTYLMQIIVLFTIRNRPYLKKLNMESILYQFGYETTELSTKRINCLSTKRPRWVRKGCRYDTTGGWIIVGSPDSITHPRSLITWGCGFSCFIVSSSFMRSLLSDSEALAEINQTGSKKIICLHCSFPKCKCNLKAHGVKVIPKLEPR